MKRVVDEFKLAVVVDVTCPFCKSHNFFNNDTASLVSKPKCLCGAVFYWENDMCVNIVCELQKVDE